MTEFCECKVPYLRQGICFKCRRKVDLQCYDEYKCLMQLKVTLEERLLNINKRLEEMQHV